MEKRSYMKLERQPLNIWITMIDEKVKPMIATIMLQYIKKIIQKNRIISSIVFLFILGSFSNYRV